MGIAGDKIDTRGVCHRCLSITRKASGTRHGNADSNNARAEFFTNVGKMTLVGLAAALLSTTLLYLAFRFGYLVDTTCWFNTCG